MYDLKPIDISHNEKNFIYIQHRFVFIHSSYRNTRKIVFNLNYNRKFSWKRQCFHFIIEQHLCSFFSKLNASMHIYGKTDEKKCSGFYFLVVWVWFFFF